MTIIQTKLIKCITIFVDVSLANLQIKTLVREPINIVDNVKVLKIEEQILPLYFS